MRSSRLIQEVEDFVSSRFWGKKIAVMAGRRRQGGALFGVEGSAPFLVRPDHANSGIFEAGH